MALPHKTAPYPHLAKAVNLPAPKVATQPEGDDGSRRRNRRGVRQSLPFTPQGEGCTPFQSISI